MKLGIAVAARRGKQFGGPTRPIGWHTLNPTRAAALTIRIGCRQPAQIDRARRWSAGSTSEEPRVTPVGQMRRRKWLTLAVAPPPPRHYWC